MANEGQQTETVQPAAYETSKARTILARAAARTAAGAREDKKHRERGAARLLQDFGVECKAAGLCAAPFNGGHLLVWIHRAEELCVSFQQGKVHVGRWDSNVAAMASPSEEAALIWDPSQQIFVETPAARTPIPTDLRPEDVDALAIALAPRVATVVLERAVAGSPPPQTSNALEILARLVVKQLEPQLQKPA